jgi:hypothetical protein
MLSTKWSTKPNSERIQRISQSFERTPLRTILSTVQGNFCIQDISGKSHHRIDAEWNENRSDCKSHPMVAVISSYIRFIPCFGVLSSGITRILWLRLVDTIHIIASILLVGGHMVNSCHIELVLQVNNLPSTRLCSGLC